VLLLQQQQQHKVQIAGLKTKLKNPTEKVEIANKNYIDYIGYNNRLE